jgi:hypothetical protein
MKHRQRVMLQRVSSDRSSLYSLNQGIEIRASRIRSDGGDRFLISNCMQTQIPDKPRGNRFLQTYVRWRTVHRAGGML